MDLAALYLETKVLADINAPSVFYFPREPNDLTAIATQFPQNLRPRVKEIFAGPNACANPKLRLIELVALNGDKEFYDWLVAHGANPALNNHWCARGPFATPFSAERLIALVGK
jgi:hypothetical protein